MLGLLRSFSFETERFGVRISRRLYRTGMEQEFQTGEGAGPTFFNMNQTESTERGQIFDFGFERRGIFNKREETGATAFRVADFEECTT
jgi:hypothetical protein